jgi:hypothetical protein
LLSQYHFCAGGVGLGVAYSLKYKKGLIPMVAAGVGGTLADLIWGRVVACKEEAKRVEDLASSER